MPLPSPVTSTTPMPTSAPSLRGSRWQSSSPAWGRPDSRRSSMSDASRLDAFLAAAHVDPEVFALRGDYRALLLAVEGLVPAPSDAASEALLRAAESAAARAL